MVRSSSGTITSKTLNATTPTNICSSSYSIRSPIPHGAIVPHHWEDLGTAREHGEHRIPFSHRRSGGNKPHIPGTPKQV